MRSVKFQVGLALVVSAVLSGATAVAAQTSTPTGKPVLSLRSEAPLVVGGHGFRAGERVAVVVSAAGSAFRKSATAGRKGRFSIRFSGVDASCGPLYVQARGDDGSRAGLRRRSIAAPCGADPGP